MSDQHHPDDPPIEDDPSIGHDDAAGSHPHGDPDRFDLGNPLDAGDADEFDLSAEVDDLEDGPDDDPFDPDDDRDDDRDDDTGATHEPISLDLDEHADDRDDDPDDDPDDGQHDTDPIDLADPDLADPGLGDGYDAPTMAALADLGGVEPAQLRTALVELGLAEAVDARSAVVALERLGVDTRVVFGDIDRLAELVSGGGAVRLGDAMLVEIDDRTDEALVEHADGHRVRLPLDELEARWAEHGFEFVLGADHQAVLPLTIGTDRPKDDVGGLSG